MLSPKALHSGGSLALRSTSATLLSISPYSSRPNSRLGGLSSGYESSTTRSHLGPLFSEHNMPRGNSPEPRYNSLKPRRRKQHKEHRSATQFYSLRLCRKHQQHHHEHLDEEEGAPLSSSVPGVRPRKARKNYQLYAIPIYRSCPHKSLDSTPTSTISRVTSRATSRATSRDTDFEDDEDPGTASPPPVPAPRHPKKSDPAEHTYQNVPPPVFPQDSKLKVRPPSSPGAG